MGITMVNNVQDVYDVIDLQIGNDAKYSGQVLKSMNLKHGHGIQIWDDGSKYTGNWQYGKAHGFGIFYHANGDTFEGNFVNDKANGKGLFTHSNG